MWDWMRGETKRIKQENKSEAEQATQRDTGEREKLIQTQRNQRQWMSQRQTHNRQSMQELRRKVMEDHAKYTAMSEPSRDERKEEFKRQRRATSERQPRRSRGYDPEM